MADSLTSTEVVPAFRADLTISDPHQGAGEKLVTVADPKSGKSMAFRGFELSIARMLNGVRTADEVIEAAAQIGLPISLEGLAGFVRKLKTLDFLSHPLDGPVEKASTWDQRREWSDEIRKRYQVALKEARSNNLLSAKERLLELSNDAPDNTDIQQLRNWVEERLRAPMTGKKLPTFTDVFAVVERGWFEEGERQSAENARAQAVVETSPPPPPPAELDLGISQPLSEPLELPKRGGAGKVVLVLLLLLVVGGGAAAALVPLPYRVKGTYELSARQKLPVEVAREGMVGDVPAKEGAWVEQGAVLFTYDTEGARKKLADAEKAVVEAKKKLEKSPAGKKSGEAKKKLEKAQADVKEATDELEAAKAKAKGKKSGAVTKAEKKVKKAEAALAKVQKAAEAGAGKGDELKADLDKATAERDSLKAQSEATPFSAPAAGFVTGLKLKAGDEVKAGSTVCQLSDSKVMLVKMVVGKGDALEKGQTVDLTVEGKSVKVKVEKVSDGAAEATLDNAKGAYKAGTKGELSIDGGGRTLLSRF